MSQELAQGTQEPTTTTEPTAAPSAAPASEPTLDDVYRSAGLDVQPSAPAAAPPQQTQVQQPPQQPPQAPQIPDAFDVDAHRDFLARQQRGLQTTAQAVSQMAQYLTQIQQREAAAQLEKDVASAVQTVNEVVKHPKPKVIEAMLDAKAREDVKFKALFDNRGKNPDAWNRALGVVAREFAKELDVRADPSLIEAQRARQLSQRQMATTAQDPPDNSWDGLSQADFDARWQSMVGQ